METGGSGWTNLVHVHLAPAVGRHAFPFAEGAVEGGRILIAEQAGDFVNVGCRIGQEMTTQIAACV